MNHINDVFMLFEEGGCRTEFLCLYSDLDSVLLIPIVVDHRMPRVKEGTRLYRNGNVMPNEISDDNSLHSITVGAFDGSKPNKKVLLEVKSRVFNKMYFHKHTLDTVKAPDKDDALVYFNALYQRKDDNLVKAEEVILAR